MTEEDAAQIEEVINLIAEVLRINPVKTSVFIAAMQILTAKIAYHGGLTYDQYQKKLTKNIKDLKHIWKEG